MKRYLKFLVSIILMGIFVFLISRLYKQYNISVMDKNIKCILSYKGLKGAEDITSDEEGNIFVAYRNKIQCIEKSGKSYDVLKDESLDITSIEYSNGQLYYASKSEILCYSLKDKNQKIIMKDLPNFGDYRNSEIKILGENLFISIGAATNSGVVGNDNIWLKDSPFFHDLSPKEMVIKGHNFGSEKTGAFVSYKTKSYSSQIVPSHFPGNSSIVTYNINTGVSQTFAWGIRNVTGMDFGSDGKLFAATGGMEKRGLRPVTGDCDYIYEIENNVWYGWPDFSGGDPITSPRFRIDSNNKVDFILDKHPSSNPPAPLYQHKTVSTLGSIAIDKFGYIGEKDSIYFYDFKDNNICELNKNNVLSEKIELSKESKIGSIKFTKGKLLILDKEQGCIYFIVKK